MANCVITRQYPPSIDVTKAPIAYGDRALPRLNRELADVQQLTRQRALRSLCDYLHDPEHVAAAIQEGIPITLATLINDFDPTCRQKASECFSIFASHGIGRDALVQMKLVVPISKRCTDKEDVVRANIHKCLELVSEGATGAEAIVEAGLQPNLVDYLKTELDPIKIDILDTLHFSLRFDPTPSLGCGAMDVFTDLLSHQDSAIRHRSARNLMDLTTPLDGKKQALNGRTVPRLIELLKDESADVRANAAGALGTIAITTPGKYASLTAISSLVPLVHDGNSEVRANALRTITVLSEAPEGRKELLEHVGLIKQAELDEVPIVKTAAKRAVEVITWRP